MGVVISQNLLFVFITVNCVVTVLSQWDGTSLLCNDIPYFVLEKEKENEKLLQMHCCGKGKVKLQDVAAAMHFCLEDFCVEGQFEWGGIFCLLQNHQSWSIKL